MPQKSDLYPLDASERYPLEDKGKPFQNWQPDKLGVTGQLVNPDNKDFTVYAAQRTTVAVGGLVYDALAYLDIIDKKQDEALETVQGDIARLREDLASLTRTVETLVGFFGAIVPNWRTKTEVEKGDDMGLVVQSAEALGLTVDYQVWQDEPGFDHEQVVSITPPPGTLVAKGGTVVVVINLQH